jgi:hypothetical protein
VAVSAQQLSQSAYCVLLQCIALASASAMGGSASNSSDITSELGSFCCSNASNVCSEGRGDADTGRWDHVLHITTDSGTVEIKRSQQAIWRARCLGPIPKTIGPTGYHVLHAM